MYGEVDFSSLVSLTNKDPREFICHVLTNKFETFLKPFGLKESIVTWPDTKDTNITLFVFHFSLPNKRDMKDTETKNIIKKIDDWISETFGLKRDKNKDAARYMNFTEAPYTRIHLHYKASKKKIVELDTLFKMEGYKEVSLNTDMFKSCTNLTSVSFPKV